MSYKRVAVQKPDGSKNPDNVDTSMGRYYLKMGMVKGYDGYRGSKTSGRKKKG